MISIQFIKQRNTLINEDLVQPRIVNMQTLEFNEWCNHLADGSTVTAADAAAVMKQLETKLPMILAMNAKVACSPEGLTFRPKVSGSITQSQLKAKLEARKAAETDPEKAAAIDVNRALTTSDLTISDCTVSIVVDLPKEWNESFMQKAKLKRVNVADNSLTPDPSPVSEGSNNDNPNPNQNGGGEGSENETPATVAAPSFSGETQFTESTQVTISGPTGATIYYTVDGSTPTAESTQYSEPLTFTETTTLKAIAIKDGVSSAVTSRTYTKGSNGGDGDDENGED